MCMCKFESKRTEHIISSDDWNIDMNRDEIETREKREKLCAKLSISSHFWESYTQYITLVRVSVYWFDTQKWISMKTVLIQAVPFHHTHTNTFWHSHISISYVCLCISMLYRRLDNSLPFEKQQQQQNRMKKTTTEICFNLSTSNCFAVYIFYKSIKISGCAMQWKHKLEIRMKDLPTKIKSKFDIRSIKIIVK